MKKIIFLLSVLALATTCCYAETENFASCENKPMLTNEEIAKNTIGVFKAQIEPLNEEIKTKLQESLNAALASNAYQVIEMTLDSTTKSTMAKAYIKVTREIKAKNDSYNEIQENLAEIQKICVEAATIDGVCHLENMSKFVFVHSKNSYSYVKTLLK